MAHLSFLKFYLSIITASLTGTDRQGGNKGERGDDLQQRTRAGLTLTL